jgi:hypothetical protein
MLVHLGVISYIGQEKMGLLHSSEQEAVNSAKLTLYFENIFHNLSAIIVLLATL